MTEYARGFRDGVEAAAKIADDSILGSVTRDPPWVWLAIVRDRIRTLAPPSPEPATRPDNALADLATKWADEGKTESGHQTARHKTLWRCAAELREALGRDPAYGGAPAPAPGPERCGHRGFEWENTVTKRCIRCGAKWRDDGQGWRRP